MRRAVGTLICAASILGPVVPAGAVAPRAEESYSETVLLEVDQQRPVSRAVRREFHLTWRGLCCGPGHSHVDQIHPVAPLAPVHRLYGIVAEQIGDTRGTNWIRGWVEGADAALFGTPTAPLITVDAFRSEAAADCVNGSSANGTKLTGVRIAGQALPAEIPPNLRVDLGAVTVILNEQQRTPDGLGILVAAIHVISNATADPATRVDVMVGRATAAVACPAGSRAGRVPADLTVEQSWSPARWSGPATWTIDVRNTGTTPCLVTRLTLIAPVGEWQPLGIAGTAATLEPGGHRGSYDVRPPDTTIGPDRTLRLAVAMRAPRTRMAPQSRYASGVEVHCAGRESTGPSFDGVLHVRG